MIALSEFDRYVLPYINGAPLPAVEDAIRDAAIEFCEKTRVITDTISRIYVSRNMPEVEIGAGGEDEQIVEILDVWSAERKLTPKTTVELDALYPAGWQELSVAEIDRVRYWYSPYRTAIRLIPYMTVNVPNALRARVSIKPTRTAAELSDELFEHYAEDIAAGALARLHRAKGADYADPREIAPNQAKFYAAIVREADSYAHGFNKPVLRMPQDDFV